MPKTIENNKNEPGKAGYNFYNYNSKTEEGIPPALARKMLIKHKDEGHISAAATKVIT